VILREALVVAVGVVLLAVGAVLVYWVATVIVSIGDALKHCWGTRHERREIRQERRKANKSAEEYNAWFRANARWFEWYNAEGFPRGGWRIGPPGPYDRPVRREDYQSTFTPWEDSWNARVMPGE
jgi:hypothetical protein